MRGMNEMVRQAQLMQKKIAKMQEELEKKVIETSSGGGMVKVKVSGQQEIIELIIDPAVVEGGDVEMIQDLVLAAVNDGMKQAKELMESEMGQVTGGLKIPGLF